MELIIDDKRSFQYAQYEFGKRYPYLKIDFLRPPVGDTIPSLGQQRARGIIHVECQQTVKQVIKGFEDIFGMSMMIRRRSGNVWIETSLTADWTLERQNHEGELFSRISSKAS
jgi:hypothetical protein